MSPKDSPKIVLIGGEGIARYTIADRVWKVIGDYFHIEFDYHILPLSSRDDFLDFLTYARNDSFLFGGNIALPWKKDFFSSCDFHDSSSEKSGIASAFTLRSGKLTSFNMDALAVFMALKFEEVDCEGRAVLILGAGGAGFALASFLADRGVEVFLTDNDTKVLGGIPSDRGIQVVLRENVKYILPKMDIIVNATTVGNISYWGGSCYVHSSPLSVPEIQSTALRAVFLEMNYRPLLTHFLEVSRLCHRKVIPGVDMLVLQALLTFKEIFATSFTKEDFYVIKSSIII